MDVSKKNYLYAVVDIETTGGSVLYDKIIDIAILLHDGEKVVKEYHTFVNPGKSIPSSITYLTGITDKMVKEAPFFHEIAEDILKMMDECIFVAHNVQFDYSFIKYELQSIGYHFNLERLCTVKLSRKVLPGYASYSLGKLVKSLGIKLTGRHTALGDTRATAELFTLIVKKDTQNYIAAYLENGNVPSIVAKNLDLNVLNKLPEKPGVYCFENQDGNVVFEDVAENIKQDSIKLLKRKLKRLNNIYDNIYNIHHEPTETVLFAKLLMLANKTASETNQQGQFWFRYGIWYQKIKDEYCFVIKRFRNQKHAPFMILTSHKEAVQFLEFYARKYKKKLIYKDKTGKLRFFDAKKYKKGEHPNNLPIVLNFDNEFIHKLITEKYKSTQDFFWITPNPEIHKKENHEVFLFKKGVLKAFGNIDFTIDQTTQEIEENLVYFNDKSYFKNLVARYYLSKKMHGKKVDLMNSH